MTKIIRDWVEPAHPVIVRRFDDLVSIYRIIRESFQTKVDSAFDKASQQIGFVVTTTLPIILNIVEKGKIGQVEFGAKSLQGTVFATEFAPVLKELISKNVGHVTPGSFSLFLLWYEALKLKLKADWIEPAHFIPGQYRDIIQEAVPSELAPGVREPAHWFDAGIALAKDEELLIAAIDEVYTDLKLSERIAVVRRENLKYVPGIREPAHYRTLIEDVIATRAARQLVPGIREPAHFRKFADLLDREDATKLIAELTDVLKKYGL